MRFLCLHGRGTNSDIFESQLAPLFSRVSPHHTFDFVDAPFDCVAAHGISQLYQPPYLTWHTQYEPQHVEPVHDFLRTVIEEDGPYDGVIGFSQGAALAASFLLCHEHYAQIRDPGRRHKPPFKVAIFINSVMTFSPSEHIGSNISQHIKSQEEKHMAFIEGVDSLGAEDFTPTETYTTIDGDSIYGFPKDTFAPRISIPTLHLYGTEDQFLEHSEELVGLCRGDRTEVLPVRGGHELPRTNPAWDKFAALFEMVAMTAALMDPSSRRGSATTS
ncbi:hypothetical protein BU16DRAFT_565538 [Lophium mytilinum]|uniref:Serine hydrolase domain-containing protein n=1 Tax=Lophium mytilinum TaxID=390894 RepID=A0A6A6QHZ7_9PEZI|nr:hypothetical protein BU16DRAFT_565538 [Lophium mytilinum]